MSRHELKGDLRVLLRKHAAKFVDFLDRFDLIWARNELEQMATLMDTVEGKSRDA